MTEDEERPTPGRTAANDNAAGARIDIDKVVLTLARLLGRQIVREDFARHRLAASMPNAGAGRWVVDSYSDRSMADAQCD